MGLNTKAITMRNREVTIENNRLLAKIARAKSTYGKNFWEKPYKKARYLRNNISRNAGRYVEDTKASTDELLIR